MGGHFSLRADAPKLENLAKQNGNTIGPEFTADEKVIIHATWSKLESSSNEIATDIFLRIFELRPEVKGFFPFRSAVGEALVKHPYFKSHALRFINAVRMTITNMDAWEVIHIPNLRKLGQHHTKLPGCTQDIFKVFYYVWAMYLVELTGGKRGILGVRYLNLSSIRLKLDIPRNWKQKQTNSLNDNDKDYLIEPNTPTGYE